MKLGAEFVGETFILLVSGGTVVWEYNRSKEKERSKEQALHDIATKERQQLTSTISRI